MGTIHYSQAIKPDTAYLKKIIENSLLCDWVIRIEFHGGETGIHCWQQWDKTFFAIKSAKQVLQAITNCYTLRPRSMIRLYAEKIRPQTRLFFTVYNPQYLPAETEHKPHSTKQPFIQTHDQPATLIRVPTQYKN